MLDAVPGGGNAGKQRYNFNGRNSVSASVQNERLV